MHRWIHRLTVVAVVGVIGMSAASGCGDPPPEGADPTTHPQYVVQAYINRLTNGDREGAAELMTEIGRRNGGSPIGTGRIEGFGITAPRPIPNHHNGRTVFKAVTERITFTRVGETSLTLNNGPAQWDFIIVQEHEGDPWLIDDQGNG